MIPHCSSLPTEFSLFLSENLSSSDNTRENSSSEIVSSSRALETRSLITLSFLSASNLILWCFSAFSIKRLLTNPHTMKRSSAPSDTASITVTAGEEITVDKNTTLIVLKLHRPPRGWRGGRVVSAFDSCSEGHWFESRWGRSLRNNCGQVVHTHRAQQGRGPA